MPEVSMGDIQSVTPSTCWGIIGIRKGIPITQTGTKHNIYKEDKLFQTFPRPGGSVLHVREDTPIYVSLIMMGRNNDTVST